MQTLRDSYQRHFVLKGMMVKQSLNLKRKMSRTTFLNQFLLNQWLILLWHRNHLKMTLICNSCEKWRDSCELVFWLECFKFFCFCVKMLFKKFSSFVFIIKIIDIFLIILLSLFFSIIVAGSWQKLMKMFAFFFWRKLKSFRGDAVVSDMQLNT